MFDGISRSDAAQSLPAYIRAQGRVRLGFQANARGTYAADLSESGGFRVKFPKTPTGARHCEAVTVNAAGGMTGGDALDIQIAVGPGAQAVVATQSAEKIYRSDGAETRIAARVTLESAANLVWAPQETILFNGARARRALAVDMAEDACMLAAETVVFGRTAMGESLTDAAFADRWRVRRGGRLIFADDVRLAGDVAATLARPAVGNGARAAATLLYAAPDAAARLEDVRALALTCEWGAGAWDGMLCARLAGADAAAVRAGVGVLLAFLSKRPLPRVWGC
jgi:urease accessory protein